MNDFTSAAAHSTDALLTGYYEIARGRQVLRVPRQNAIFVYELTEDVSRDSNAAKDLERFFGKKLTEWRSKDGTRGYRFEEDHGSWLRLRKGVLIYFCGSTNEIATYPNWMLRNNLRRGLLIDFGWCYALSEDVEVVPFAYDPVPGCVPVKIR